MTGAANGIGAAITRAFLEERAMVAALDRDADGLQARQREYGTLARQLLTVVGDATASEMPERVVEAVLAKWRRIDILVNNVGGLIGSPNFDAPLRDWDATIRLCLTSQFLFCRAVANTMITQKAGRIINIASNAGKYRSNTGTSGISYSAAKGGVLQLTRSVAHELGRHNITVNAIAPGSVLTNLGKHEAAELPPNLKERVMRETPLGYFAEPEEIAAVAVFLASNDASYITGATIVASGGWCTT